MQRVDAEGRIEPRDPLERFERLARTGPLDAAVLAIGAALRPPVDDAGTLAVLDGWAARCAAPTFGALHAVLFESAGIVGDVDDYGDPENSMLDAVVARRRGIPIMLSIVVIEVGRRAGVVVDPIGMPGHFLVQDRASGTYCDPFAGGVLLDEAGCRDRFHRLFGSGERFTPDLLAPTPAPLVLARVLANLESSRWAVDPHRLLLMLALHRRIAGLPAGERLRLAARFEALGAFDAARVGGGSRGRRPARATCRRGARTSGRGSCPHQLNAVMAEPSTAPTTLPMFPLGTVLLPGGVLPLHVFEPRYRMMVRAVLGGDGELGIVLIERGHEVGGGDTRFSVACLARVAQSEELPDGRFAIAVVGLEPIDVVEWLPDDPYPRARVARRRPGAPDPDARARARRAARREVARARRCTRGRTCDAGRDRHRAASRR